jgi:hypothetical protein
MLCDAYRSARRPRSRSAAWRRSCREAANGPTPFHSEFLLVKGGYDDGPAGVDDREIQWTGGHDHPFNSLRYGDEAFVEPADSAAHDAYEAFFKSALPSATCTWIEGSGVPRRLLLTRAPPERGTPRRKQPPAEPEAPPSRLFTGIAERKKDQARGGFRRTLPGSPGGRGRPRRIPSETGSGARRTYDFPSWKGDPHGPEHTHDG